MNLKTLLRLALSAVIASATLTQPTIAKAEAQEEVLHSFTGGNDGSIPVGGLTFDSSGNLYGTAMNGGGGTCPGSCGTVFELSPDGSGMWTETVLYVFKGVADGGFPNSGLVFDSSGNLYGTTSEGGDARYCSTYAVPGCGVVFELARTGTRQWTEKILYSFRESDGAVPDAGLVFDTAGHLYGSTFLGGLAHCPIFGTCGVVFELTPTTAGPWSETVLHRFTGGVDGASPNATPVLDAAGNLYGTAELGGRYNGGVVFELTPVSRDSRDEWRETVLHSFTGGKDGASPGAGVISDAEGNLYGTAGSGGSQVCHGGCGVVFELSPRGNGLWEEKVLHTFTGGKDGAAPVGSPILDTAGNLDATASSGGNQLCNGGCGVVFRLTRTSSGVWKETVLHTFAGKNGAYPESSPSLTLDRVGNVYGTTIYGGNLNDCQSYYYPGCGVVFEITP
jgi:uncharacterized repeat protein (TIGR03803 family)